MIVDLCTIRNFQLANTVSSLFDLHLGIILLKLFENNVIVFAYCST